MSSLDPSDWSGDARRAPHRAVFGLDDHAAGPLAEQVGGSWSDALLAGGSMDRRPVDDVRVDPFGFLDQRRAGVTRADQARMDLDAQAPGLDACALEYRSAMGLLLLQARLERELAGHRQYVDRIDDAFGTD